MNEQRELASKHKNLSNQIQHSILLRQNNIYLHSLVRHLIHNSVQHMKTRYINSLISGWFITSTERQQLWLDLVGQPSSTLHLDFHHWGTEIKDLRFKSLKGIEQEVINVIQLTVVGGVDQLAHVLATSTRIYTKNAHIMCSLTRKTHQSLQHQEQSGI